MLREKQLMAESLPFAMAPVVYRFAINDAGTRASLYTAKEAILSPEYYLLMLPRWLREGSQSFSMSQRREVEAFSGKYLSGSQHNGWRNPWCIGYFPLLTVNATRTSRSMRCSLVRALTASGTSRFAKISKSGRIGIAKNRLAADTRIEDVHERDIVRPEDISAAASSMGEKALRQGEVAVITLAAGAGSRWTQGAGTVKALHPFAKFSGRFRTFVEVHLAKSRRTSRLFGQCPPHVFTTSYVTHVALQAWLGREKNYGYSGDVRLSAGRSIGLRLVPTLRDLKFAWEQMPQQQLEERKQKVRDSAHKALMDWAVTTGEASDYRDNLPTQCIHPVGHWYEVANVLLNGTLRGMIATRPGLRYLMLHNIDTLGANFEPGPTRCHIESQALLSFEVIPRRFEDRGGGLGASMAGFGGGRPGFPARRGRIEACLYNSMTIWISIDPLLALFGLKREDLADDARVRSCVRELEAQLPT